MASVSREQLDPVPDAACRATWSCSSNAQGVSLSASPAAPARLPPGRIRITLRGHPNPSPKNKNMQSSSLRPGESTTETQKLANPELELIYESSPQVISYCPTRFVKDDEFQRTKKCDVDVTVHQFESKVLLIYSRKNVIITLQFLFLID